MVPLVFLQCLLAGLNGSWVGKLMLWACRQGDPHSFPEDRWGQGRRESFRLEHSNKLPAGNLDKLSGKVQKHRPLWDARYAWGLATPEALCHHHKSVGVARTSKPFFCSSHCQDSMQLL